MRVLAPTSPTRMGHEMVARLILGEGADMEKGNEYGATPLWIACHQTHDGVVRLLLQHGAKSIKENEAHFQPAANAVLRQWNALSPARQEIVRRYDWSFVDLPAEWTVRHHHQYPAAFRRQMVAAALTFKGLLPVDLMHLMAEDIHRLMGFGGV